MGKNFYIHYVKRGLDLLIAFFGLLIASPILICTVICLKIANRGAGVFFFQPRPGLNGKIFRIIKFKTMTDQKDANGNLLPDEDRLTPIGQFIRSTSIDELPQLINVLKGDMSLIGPRPLLPQISEAYALCSGGFQQHSRTPDIPNAKHSNCRDIRVFLLSDSHRGDSYYSLYDKVKKGGIYRLS